MVIKSKEFGTCQTCCVINPGDIIRDVPESFKNCFNISNHSYATRRYYYSESGKLSSKKEMLSYWSQKFHDLPPEIKLVNSLLVFKASIGEIFA